MPHSPGIGAIFGIVSENGVAKAAGRVGLYDRTTMLLVNKTVADSLGGYVFTGLNQTTSDYLVMALDDDGSPPKNALVQDYVQPIPANMGAVGYSNWALRARRNDAFFLWAPRFQSTYFETMGAGGYPQTFGTTGGSFLINQPTLTPGGSPQYPSLKLSTGFAEPTAFHTAYLWPISGTATESVSLEFVIDTTYDSQVTAMGYMNGNNRQSLSQIAVSWNATTKQVRLATSAGVFNIGTSFALADTNNWRMSSYTATGLPPGVHHFIMTAVLGANQKLYIDGALVFTSTAIAGTNSAFLAPQWGSGLASDAYVYLAGIDAALGLGSFGPVAAYHVALPATEVSNLYNDLMIGTTPTATGYVREILTDDPAILYRLNEASFGTASEFLTNKPSGTHYGTMTFTQPSPIVGAAMTHFGGGGVRALRGAGGGSPLQRSWEFWVNPDTAAPPATRTLFLSHGNDDVSTSIFWKVQQVQTTGALRLILTLAPSGSLETITFVYAPPAGVTKHIVITIDKLVGVCNLYVNGAFQETQTITSTLLYEGSNNITATNNRSFTDTQFHIGGWITSTITFNEMFFGSLGDIALYYRLLGPDRIQAHYDARLLI